MTNEPPSSFSPMRKWSFGLNVLVSSTAVLALLLMTNYLAARHYTRWSWSASAQAQLSPLSLRVLTAVTNPVKVTLYFDKENPLFELSYNLLKMYRYANDRIQLNIVHYVNEPGAAELVKRRYDLSDTDRDMVIFECQDRKKVVLQSELSDIDIQPLVTGKSREAKRTHFKGETMFTSAIYSVITARQAKAYFLGGQHNPESDDGMMGYSRFAAALRESNLRLGRLRLEGSAGIPNDCNLLIIAGPSGAFSSDALEQIERYLKQGGRLLALFNSAGVRQQTGLEEILAGWGVAVGQNVVIDEKSHDAKDKNNMVVFTYGTHPIVKPLDAGHSQLFLVLPRSVEKIPQALTGADAPQVDPLVSSSADGRVITEIRRDGLMVGSLNDRRGTISLMVAVEKGGIRNVSAERGATRIVVAGDSLFLNNNNIDREGNHQLATHIINWLLARNDLLVPVPPRPMPEYKLTMTEPQLSAARWILMGGFPGAVLLLGGLVWLRRRR